MPVTITWIGKRVLQFRQHRVSRQKCMVSLSEAREVGILFPVNGQLELHEVMEYSRMLSSGGISVDVLGFVNDRQVPGYCFDERNARFFCRRDLNFFSIPVHPFVRYFIRKEYDILFDLDHQSLFPLDYIIGLSHASLRVGPLDEARSHLYDMMIGNPEGSFRDFLKHASYYLTEIRSPGKTPPSEAGILQR
ncbi:MAG: hypothetical protein JW861_01110 [Bacteroidales bacterium]|nr:hypothetical protein [Bacteroidales bacterium]